MKAYWGSGRPLASALDAGEWSASHPGRFIPRERAPGTHWIGWVESTFFHTSPKVVLSKFRLSSFLFVAGMFRLR
jgi:hypothetical protein